MQKGLWTKKFVFVMIGLFTGVTILPNICGNMIELEYNEDTNMDCKVIASETIGHFHNPTLIYAIMCDWVDDNGQHGPAKTRFLSSQQVYFYAEIENVDVGDVFAGEWWFNENFMYLVNHSNPTNWSGSGYLSFSWKPPYAGIWQVKLYHGYHLGVGPKFSIINSPPNTPTVTGEISGAKKTSYVYTIQTTDPEKNKVRYYIDWADGTHNITDFYKSGEEINISHKWDKKGTYSVKVQAIDECWASSDWATLTVTMPYSYNIPLFQFWGRLLERFSNAFPFLRQLINY